MSHLHRIAVLWACVAFTSAVSAEQYHCQSPDGAIKVVVTVDQDVSWSATYKDRGVLQDCRVGLTVNGKELPGAVPHVTHAQTNVIREEIRPTVPTKAEVLQNHAGQVTISFEGGIALQLRAYNTGVAYRFITDLPGEIQVNDERFEIRFIGDCQTFFPKEDSLQSHYERDYLRPQLAEISSNEFCSLPVLVKCDTGVYVAVTDADLYDYPATFLSGTGGNAMRALFPKAVLRAEDARQGPDRNQRIVEEADYIAKTTGKRPLPWRVVMICDRMGPLLEDDLVFKLSRPLRLDDTKWIKPGKVAWDWWNALNIYGVDFDAGINTQTYKYYIDFASKYNLEYIILDEGWSASTTNLLETKPDVDVKELVEYGKAKDVGVILWTLWKPLDNDMEKVLDLWASWGVRGIKVDFMQRADQQMVNFYERAAREAAKRKLLVDYHGAFKPAGLRRAYPNVINYEGLRGLENCKWTDAITPEHDLTLPFVRMLAGPMDYTPGAMDNAHKENFVARFTRPMSQGTRCHQVAMYVIYDAPLQMLSDTPSAYLRDPRCTSFIAAIPTTWNETKVVSGEPGQFLVMARRHGDKWYVAAMSNQQPRDLAVPLSFLPEGSWHLDLMRDGVNAARIAIDYSRDTMQVTNKSQLDIHLAPGGGWAGILTRE